jgi:hypothetical protein
MYRDGQEDDAYTASDSTYSPELSQISAQVNWHGGWLRAKPGSTTRAALRPVRGLER